ncbi:hypothetical protein ONE63_004626 [Megalurothrips usitatus]|uniref:Atos-like conserved domain-containing protein n=1 Tax=Megalurothrips usitatus TaxID=439358 RepID=A0AAV7X0A7_9NEOP|nr:hypothetical protein ONE63_004626 [Megalurothrips usitatus]KAJ1519328.1 hypothetical protein ONE63_004626 [Megalurothrips usitatus]
MHSMMEGEGGSEPQDVFVELGTLIVEGRVPGGTTARGYGEGPHCSAQGLANAASRHICNPHQNILCKRAESFRKHMQLMFQNNVPMCIEVILCSDCPCGAQKAQSTEVGIVPSASDLLLEQWTITYNNRHCDPAPMLARGLIQAVRSQLHFSQLSAWWSSSKGVQPSNVTYRITVPGQAFSSQFSRPPSEHTFPLASVGKTGSIKVCTRSLPRMDLVPVIHCPLHSTCLPPSNEVGEKTSKPCVQGSETACGTSALAGGDTAGVKESSLGESLLDLPQRFRSPPRAAEAPDRYMYRVVPTEAVSAWWPGGTPLLPAPGPVGRWCWRGGSSCVGLCPRVAASKKTGRPSGLLDDRMQMECTTPGKHHCSCEVEEEIEEVKTPAQVRQRRRSQASMPPASTSAASDPAHVASESVANESTKRSSGLSVMTDEYLYMSDGNNGSNTGSLKRRRPVLDPAEPSGSDLHGKSWMDAEGNHDIAANSCFTSAVGGSSSGVLTGGAGGAAAFGLSPSKGTTAPVQLQPPLSRQELENVLSVLRDRSKASVRPIFHHLAQPVYYSSESSSRHKVAGDSGDLADTSCPFFRASSADADKKANKTDPLMDALLHSVESVHQRNTVCQTPCSCCEKVKDDLMKNKCGAKEESHCDKSWSDMKCFDTSVASVKSDGQSSFGANSGKPSYDLSEDHNNHVICDNDKYTSLQKCDSDKSCLCVMCISRTQASQTKEGNELQTSNSSQFLCSKISGAGSKRLESPNTSIAIQCVAQELQKDLQNGSSCRQDVPSASERARFRRSFDNAASMVFHTRTGLPLTSSPAPVRRGTSRFDYDSSLNSVSAIRSALFDTPGITTQMEDSLSLSSDDTESESGARSPCSPDAGIVFPSLSSCHALSPCSSLLGSFEESVLNGRLEPVSTVQGFTAEIGASGSFCPRHLKLPVTVFFYTLGDYDKVSTPYLGHINLGKKGYNVPRSGTIQVTLFNPMGTVIKMFVVMYDLADMPPNSHTFLRQRTLYMPTGMEVSDELPESDLTQKWLRYLIHLRFSSSKSGRIYLHTDVRMIIFRKSDMDTATVHNNNNIDSGFELRSYTHGPGNPKFSPR